MWKTTIGLKESIWETLIIIIHGVNKTLFIKSEFGYHNMAPTVYQIRLTQHVNIKICVIIISYITSLALYNVLNKQQGVYYVVMFLNVIKTRDA